MFATRVVGVFWYLVLILSVDVIGESFVPPIKEVRRGFKNRVEFISAEIHREHLDNGTTPGAAAKAFVKQMTDYDNDDVGQLISAKLGGAGNETYNFVPMNCFIKLGLWQPLIETPVYQMVSSGTVVKLSISMTYHNTTSTRPSKFDFSLDSMRSSDDPKDSARNSTLDNPVPIIPCLPPMVTLSQVVRNETTITSKIVTLTNATVAVPQGFCETNGNDSTACQNMGLSKNVSHKPESSPILLPVLQSECQDNENETNCSSILKSNLCAYQNYSKICCKTCMNAGQLPLQHSGSVTVWELLQNITQLINQAAAISSSTSNSLLPTTAKPDPKITLISTTSTPKSVLTTTPEPDPKITPISTTSAPKSVLTTTPEPDPQITPISTTSTPKSVLTTTPEPDPQITPISTTSTPKSVLTTTPEPDSKITPISITSTPKSVLTTTPEPDPKITQRPTTEQKQLGCQNDKRKSSPRQQIITDQVSEDPYFKGCAENCSKTEFGCCPDGITVKTGPDYGGCDREICSLPKSSGECRDFDVVFWFDNINGGCEGFWYGGCGGNKNRFKTLDECQSFCVRPTGKDLCSLPMSPGSCRSNFQMWYYHKTYRQCRPFSYTGCLGNINRFYTREECEVLCGSQEHFESPPYIRYDTDQRVEAEEGTDVGLHCIAGGTPTPIVAWKRNGEMLSPISGSKYRISQNGTLEIILLKQEDEGTYTCEASNGIQPSATRDYDLIVKGTLPHAECKDHKPLVNCSLIVVYRYCFHKYYAKNCCKSCTEDGQLPSHTPGALPPWENLQAHSRRPRSLGRMLPSRLTPVNAPDHESDFKVRFENPIPKKFNLHLKTF